MAIGRDSAYPATDFDGAGTDISGFTNKCDTHHTYSRNESQCKHVCNKFGHDKFNPKQFIPPDHHKPRTNLQNTCSKALGNAYFHPLDNPIGKVSFNDKSFNVDKSYRKRRSEFRELLYCKILKLFVHFCDISTGIIGQFKHSFDLKSISNMLKVPYKSITKVIKFIEEKGYISVNVINKRGHDGVFRHQKTILKFNNQFFYDLGITETELDKYQAQIARKKTQEDIVARKKYNDELKKHTKKTAKKAFKNLKVLIDKKKAKQPLTDEEIEILDREFPGRNRLRSAATPLYRDYTGCAHDDRILFNNDPQPAPSFLSLAIKKPPS